MPDSIRHPLRDRRARALVAACLLAVLFPGCGVGESREQRVARVEASFASADFRAAVIDLKNLVREEPQNADFRLRLAEALLRTGDPEAAAVEARKARELGAPDERVVPLLAEALIGHGRFQEALEELSSPEWTEKRDVKILRLRGGALLGLGRPIEARQEFGEALELDPRDTAARLGLAAALSRIQGPEAAKAEIDRAVELAPEDLDAQIALATWYAQAGEAEAAHRTFTTALPLAERTKQPGSLALVLAGIADMELALGRLDAARETIARLEKVAAKADVTLLLSARLALQQGRPSDAQPLLQEVLRRNPEHAQAKLLLGALSATQGKLAQAEMYLSSAVTARPNDPLARKLLADVQIRQGKPGDALQIIGEPEGAADPELLALAGRASVLLGDLDAAVEYFERGRAAAPDDDASALNLATAYLASGRTADALALLEDLEVAEPLVHRREILLLSALARSGQRDAVRAEARRFAAARPRDESALLVAARGLLDAGDVTGARELVRQATRLDDRAARPWVTLGLLEWSQKQTAAAESAFDEALRRDPKDAGALMGKAQVLLARGDSQGAIAQLESARQASAEAVAPRLALARLYLARDEAERAAEVIGEAAKQAPEDANVRALQGLTALARREPEQAIRTFEALVREHPKVASFHTALARSYAAVNRPEDARRANARALEADPKYWPALHFDANVAVAEGDAARAEKLIARLREAGAPLSVLTSLRADLAARRSEFAEAARLYREAYEAGPTEALALREYGARRAANLAEPHEPLRRWLAEHPQSADARFALAQYLQEGGDAGGAMREYEILVKHAPKHAVALNNLAWLKVETGETATGLELAKRAFELHDAPPIADTYGWALVKAGRAAEAIIVLRKAHEAVPQDPEIRYHFAVALAEAGRSADAVAHLEALVSAQEGFPMLDEARRLLESLKARRGG